MKKRKKISFGSALINALLLTFSVSCLFPIVWLFYASFNDMRSFNKNPIALPKSINLENYHFVLTKSALPRSMLNSAIVTVFSVALIVVLGFILGYFLARYKFRGNSLLHNYFMLGMLIPIHALLIPINLVMIKFGLSDSLTALILVYTAFGLPLAVFMVESYIHSIPKEMEEAAAIDGASFSQTLFKIILPMAIPILATVSIIEFFRCWNEFSFALVLINSESKFTVPMAMMNFKGLHLANYPRMMAGTFFSILPVMVLYFFSSKKIMDGMVAGAVKG